MRKFDTDARAYGLAPVEIAIRWIAYHSSLNEQDGVILGASTNDQIRETVGMIKKGPLPGEALESVEHLWDAVKDSRGGII